MKVVIVMPAYNSSKTLELTVRHIPEGVAEKIILGDDGSTDGRAELARKMGLEVIRHERNRGYGANQKGLFDEGAQDRGRCGARFEDVEEGSEGGMPRWKIWANRFLSFVGNMVF